jgi:lipoprotein-releasing system permease protein
MARSFEFYVATRYLLARRKQAFISLISLISTLGVMLGVMALIVALALMTGLQQELRDRITGSEAHVYVWNVAEGGFADYRAEAERLGGLPHVRAAAPSILGKALATTRNGEAFITVKGIDPSLERHVTEVAESVQRGSLFDLEGLDVDEPVLGGVVIGQGVAEQLGAFVGDEVTLITEHGTLSPVGMMPRPRRLRVVGTFSLGLYTYDNGYGFVTLEVAKRLLNKDRVELMELRIDDIYESREVASEVSDALGAGYLTEDWSQLNQSLFSALWLEKMAMFVAIGLIVMVAALNIVASLILLVMEKSRDIAILKTMGAGSRSIMKIFMLQGVIIGTIGTAVGATGGYVVATLLDRYQVIRLDMEVYDLAYVPFAIETFDFGLVIVSALAICFFATIYPARQASRLDPAEALRYQ